MNFKTNQLIANSRWMAWLITGSLFAFAGCQGGNEGQQNTNAVQGDSTLTTNQTAVPQETGALNPNQLAVLPPFKGVDVPFTVFKVRTDKAQTLTVETGTTIEIPANAFVDKNGNPVQGEVEIKYREFHNAADILVSGIPMQDPATGAYMETAGMFEIGGTMPNGEEIRVAKGVDLMVNMGSFNASDVEGKTPQFDFFELKRPTCGWDKKGTTAPVKNTEKANTLRRLDSQLPVRPVKPMKAGMSDNFVFDLEVNYSRFPELKMFKGVVWQYADDPKNANNPEKNPWVFETDWADIELQRSGKEGTFELVLRSQEKSFKCPVQPVLKGNDYSKAIADFEERMKDYDKIREGQVQERTRADRQADLIRSLSVQGFGIYNWDIWKNVHRLRCPTEVVFEDKALEAIKDKLQFFLVTESDKSVIQYTAVGMKEWFSFIPNTKNKLVAVLPGNKVATFAAFDDLLAEHDRLDNHAKACKITMKVQSKAVQSVQDVENMLASL